MLCDEHSYTPQDELAHMLICMHSDTEVTLKCDSYESDSGELTQKGKADMHAATYNHVALHLNRHSPTMKQDKGAQHTSDTVSQDMSALAPRFQTRAA